MTVLLGRVVVVAGDDERLADVAASAITAGAKVAVVSQTLGSTAIGSVRFNADPRDPDVWERIAMYVEQHLGPVDGVVTDEQSQRIVEAVFGPDLARRGRAPVLVLAGDDVEDVLTHLARTPPTAPSRPRPVARDQ